MKAEHFRFSAPVCAAALAALLSFSTAGAEPEELLRVRNIARAHYQNEHFAKAAVVYRECVALAPDSAVDFINLAVSEGQARETPQALVSATRAWELDQSYPHSLYLMGLMSFRLGQMDDAEKAFSLLLERDPLCLPARYARGQAYQNMGRTADAIADWERVIELDSNHGPTYYQLFRYFTGSGESERAQAAFDEFVRVKDEGLGPGKTEGAVFKSRYFDLLDEVVPKAEPGDGSGDIELTLVATEPLGAASGSVLAVGDYDDDGFVDLSLDGDLHRNESGSFSFLRSFDFEDVDRASFGDLDNDEALDIATLGTTLHLTRGDAAAGFESMHSEDVVAAVDGSGLLQLVDIDHEGDIDLLVAERGGEFRLLRNNGNSTFTDVTEASQIVGMGTGLRAVLVSDLESDFDVDVLVADSAGKLHLFVNERDGSFLPEAELCGLADAVPAVSVLAGDLNADANPDLVVFGGEGKAAQIWMNLGDARFHLDETSPRVGERTQAIGASEGHLVDLDNDGDLDLLASGSELLLFRNDGAGGWSEWSNALDGARPLRSMHDRDFDVDGDLDVVGLAPDGKLVMLRNDGGNANKRVRIRLTGTKNCLDGYGAKIWTRAGSFFQVREVYRRWIDVGVGKRDQLDVLGIRWPTGVTQNEIDLVVDAQPVLEVTERPGLAESCPFVYAYDGEGFHFITDFLDVTPLGISLAPGVPFVPADREAVLIAGDQLVAEDDRYSLRVTQELREITYLDRVELFVVDHPAGSEVLPNDFFKFGHTPERGIHLAAEPFEALRAEDAEGNDLSEALRHADRVYADDCAPIARRYPGITRRHSIILDPGTASGDAPLMLFLRGSTLWTEASINVAVSQNPDIQLYPISLDVVGEDGEWQRLHDDIGLPSGMDKFLPVDLEGAFPTADRSVRISTNLAILWDQAFFADGPTLNREALRTHRLSVLSADLHYRGFSKIFSPDNKLPDLYDYDELYPQPLFEDIHSGDYTRYGEVAPLLTAVDDRFVILAPGDEISVEFPAIMLPELPEGWVRDFVFEADGWIKDGDLRTVTGDQVAPLPFHGMSSYPYAGDQYPGSELHRNYLEEYQTRTLPPWKRSARRP